MALVYEQHEWGAKKVRQTFLDYFKKNGHSFGMSWTIDSLKEFKLYDLYLKKCN